MLWCDILLILMRVSVILPAAGLGTRMAGGHAPHTAPKQFLELAGTPILIRTLQAFAEVPEASELIVAVRATEMERLTAHILEHGFAERVRVVEGGDSRQESVFNALETLECDENDIVLVHDAVRPLIEPAIIRRVIEAVEKHNAAIVGLPALDTIKQVERTADGAIITATIPREYIVQAQTPQGFRYGLLRRAFLEAQADGFVGTDEASLAERAGSQVFVVPGSASNLKITQPGDLELAEFYLGHRGNSH
jgi:2-C-methyl-D-erythritol 4-phosphate cytidylyltransferase